MALESIALIPSGVKATKVYSQLPVNGNGDFTFDRGTSTTQTRVNKNGLIEDVSLDVPRLDYLDGGCPSLLLEPASTNLITYSEELDNVAWVSANIVDTPNQILSPDGSVNADLLTIDTATSNHYQYTDVSVSALTTYTNSVFVKAGTSDFAYVGINQRNAGFVGEAVFVFQFSTETLGSAITTATPPTGLSADWKDYGNGWYRISITGTTTSGVTVNRVQVGIAQSLSVTNHTGNGTDTIYAWGAQVEQQSYATSYIPTSGATATRDAETCNGAGTTAEINSQEGIIYIEKKAFANDGTNRIYGINKSGVGFNDSVLIRYSTTDNRITAQTRVAGVYSFQLNHDLLDALIYNKIAFKYKQDDFALYVNGLLVGVGTGNVSAGLDNFGFSFIGGNHLYGKVKKLSIYNDTTQDLEQLTGFTSFAEMKSYLSYS